MTKINKLGISNDKSIGRELTKSDRGKRSVKTEIKSLTLGLATTAIDLVVIIGAFGAGLIICGPRGKDLYVGKKLKDSWRLAEKLINLYENSRFRSALSRAAAKGYVRNSGQGRYELTETGTKRLSELLPSYKKPFTWDGRLWLITYDIPELKHQKRDLFRQNLEQIGCRMIQESVWLSVRDPRNDIRPLVDSFRLHGKVIISCLGKDGSLGDEDINILVEKVFKLKKLQKRYQSWLSAIERTPQTQLYNLTLPYMAILADDPILPRELLPSNWLGDQAKQIFEKKVLPLSGNLGQFFNRIRYY